MNLRALLKQRFTGCELAVLLWVADHGRVSGQTAFTALPYHRGSVGRARRELEVAGWLVKTGGEGWELAPKAKPYFADMQPPASSSRIQQLPALAKVEPPAQVAQPVEETSQTPPPSDPPPTPPPAKPVTTQPTPDTRSPWQKRRDDVLREFRGE